MYEDFVGKGHSMSQKVALVTGAAKGIGAACAVALGQAGYRVALHYRGSEDKAKAVQAKLPDGTVRLFQCDLTQPDAAQGLIKAEIGRAHV